MKYSEEAEKKRKRKERTTWGNKRLKRFLRIQGLSAPSLWLPRLPPPPLLIHIVILLLLIIIWWKEWLVMFIKSKAKQVSTTKKQTSKFHLSWWMGGGSQWDFLPWTSIETFHIPQGEFLDEEFLNGWGFLSIYLKGNLSGVSLLIPEGEFLDGWMGGFFPYTSEGIQGGSLSLYLKGNSWWGILEWMAVSQWDFLLWTSLWLSLFLKSDSYMRYIAKDTGKIIGSLYCSCRSLTYPTILFLREPDHSKNWILLLYLGWSFPVLAYLAWWRSRTSTRPCAWLIIFHPTIRSS